MTAYDDLRDGRATFESAPFRVRVGGGLTILPFTDLPSAISYAEQAGGDVIDVAAGFAIVADFTEATDA